MRGCGGRTWWQAYQRYYVAGNAVIAIVGALDRQAAEAVAEQVSSGLKTGQAAPPLPAVETLTGRNYGA